MYLLHALQTDILDAIELRAPLTLLRTPRLRHPIESCGYKSRTVRRLATNLRCSPQGGNVRTYTGISSDIRQKCSILMEKSL